MKYTKYSLKKYNIHIVKTDRFKKVTVQINFKRKNKKDEITIRRLLSDVLIESSLKYPSRRLIDMQVEDLYGISLSNSAFTSGNYSVMSFKGTFLNEKFTEPGMNNKSILFMLELLLNPDVKNNEFNEYGFNLSKKIIKNEINTFADYPPSYSFQRMLESMDKKAPISYRNCGYIKDLNKITREYLYDYYKSVIENDIIDIGIIGDVDEEEILKLFKDNFTRINDNIISESHRVKLKPKKESEKIEKSKINQSRLVIGCTVDTDDLDIIQYVLNVYSFILGGSGDSLLFKTVREKNSLCYSISSSHSVVSNILTISAGIDGKNKDKTVKLIKECMKEIENGNFDDIEIEKAKTIYKNSCIEMLDSPSSILNSYISHEYIGVDTLEEKMKKIDMVTKEDIINIAHKVKINIIYMLEGEKQ